MNPMERRLTNEFRKYVGSLGVELIGICHVDSLRGAPQGKRPSDILESAESIVVLGLSFLDDMVEKARSRIWSFHYIRVNGELDSAALKAARFLHGRGYSVVHIPSSVPFDTEALIGDFSHKHAAVAAGLGEIGRNNLLLTPRYGPRIGVTSLITSSPLTPTERRFEGPLCIEGCEACINACPVDALTGNRYDRWRGAEHRKDRCWARLVQLWSRDRVYGVDRLCGLCIKSCPVGRETR